MKRLLYILLAMTTFAMLVNFAVLCYFIAKRCIAWLQ